MATKLQASIEKSVATGNNPSNTASSTSSSSAVSSSSSVSVDGPSTLVKLELCVQFYEKAVKKTWLGAPKEEKIVWEKWSIPFLLTVVPRLDRERLSDSNEKFGQARQIRSVQTALMAIIEFVNQKRDHVPPMKSNSSVATFPFDVSFTHALVSGAAAEAAKEADGAAKGDEGWGLSTFKRMLKQGPPLLIKS